MLELMSRLKDGSQNTTIYFLVLGKLGVGWSVNLKIKNWPKGQEVS